MREVALRGSFSAAAEALSYSQPAVSQQIARLEAQAGVKLIERQPKGIHLTPAGEALVRHTERILCQLADAQAELAEISTAARGRLRLAVVRHRRRNDRAARGVRVPPPAPGRAVVDLQLMDPPQSIPALRRGEFDIVIIEEGGFAAEPELVRPRRRAPDGRRAVRVAARRPPARHAARDRARRPVDEDWMLVGLRGTCADSNIVLRACQQAGFEPRVAYTSDDYFAIQGLVASGMGVALVPGPGTASARATTSPSAHSAAARPTAASARSSRPIPSARWRSWSTACAMPPRSTSGGAVRRGRMAHSRWSSYLARLAGHEAGENVRYAAAAGGPRRRPIFTLLPAERPPGRREEQAGGRSASRRPWPFLEPRLVCWGERGEYSQ